MGAGDLYYFSSEGAYNIAAQSVNTTNAVTSTSTANLGLLGGLTYGGTANQMGAVSYQYVSQPSALQEYLEKATQPVKAIKKKAKDILAQLCEEIDDWHGDILERCPA